MHRKSGDESIDYFLYANKFSGDVKIMEPSLCLLGKLYNSRINKPSAY